MDYSINDKVSTVNAPGIQGTVCEIGTGGNLGRYRVQWDSKRTWIRANRLILRERAA